MSDKIRFGALFKQIHDEMERKGNNELRGIGMTFSQLDVLMHLMEAQDETMSFKMLEKKLHIAQSTTAGLLSRLEEKGLIKTWISPKDKRVKLAGLTQAGEVMCRQAQGQMERSDAELTNSLSEEEKEQLHSMLKKICSDLSSSR